jgi:hypothetical protein
MCTVGPLLHTVGPYGNGTLNPNAIKILFLKKSWFFSVDADSSRQSHAGASEPSIRMVQRGRRSEPKNPQEDRWASYIRPFHLQWSLVSVSKLISRDDGGCYLEFHNNRRQLRIPTTKSRPVDQGSDATGFSPSAESQYVHCVQPKLS